MINLVLYSVMSFGVVQDPVVITANEPRRADYRSIDFEVHCGARKFSLKGISGDGPRYEAPSAFMNRRRISLSSDLQSFLLAERAAYRIFATCPESSPAFQLRIHRAVGSPEGNAVFSVRALDISADGIVTDRGTETSDAETFWLR